MLNTRVSLRLLVRRDDQAAQDLGQLLRVAAAQVLQHVGEAAAGAEADDRRRRERDDGAALDLAELLAEARDDRRRAVRRRPCVPRTA